MPSRQEMLYLFDNYSSPSDLPKSPQYLDSLVRLSVGLINDSSRVEKALTLLENIHPKDSAKYLVGALDKDCEKEYATHLLLKYGPSDDTTFPLVAGLQNEGKTPSINYILSSYGGCDYTIRHLIGGLKHPLIKDNAKSLLLSYGPSNIACKYLIISLREEQNHPIISEIFNDFGPSAVTVKSLLYGLELNDKNTTKKCKDILTSYGRKATSYLLKHNRTPKNNYFLR